MDVSRICSDLVAINSENPPDYTVEVIEYIRNYLEKIGIRSDIHEGGPGLANLVTLGTGQNLLFCGHVDVVPANGENWSHPPFSGDIEGDFVYGRGATDMKGPCASLLAACEHWVDHHDTLPATLAFVCDEETGGDYGIRHLLAEEIIRPCDCVVAEPTPVRNPCIGQKGGGLCRLNIRFSGVPAHGTLYPSVGVSAIMEAMEFLEYVKTLPQRTFTVPEDVRRIISGPSDIINREFFISDSTRVLERLTFNPGVIRGGEKANVVAQFCDLELEMRIPWGCNSHDLVQDLAAHAHGGKIIESSVHDPSLTDPGCDLVSTVCREVYKVHGGHVFPIVQWAASDARHLRSAGFMVAEYGPGEIATLHAVDERVRIDSLKDSEEVYHGILESYANSS